MSQRGSLSMSQRSSLSRRRSTIDDHDLADLIENISSRLGNLLTQVEVSEEFVEQEPEEEIPDGPSLDQAEPDLCEDQIPNDSPVDGKPSISLKGAINVALFAKKMKEPLNFFHLARDVHSKMEEMQRYIETCHEEGNLNFGLSCDDEGEDESSDEAIMLNEKVHTATQTEAEVSRMPLILRRTEVNVADASNQTESIIIQPAHDASFGPEFVQRGTNGEQDMSCCPEVCKLEQLQQMHQELLEKLRQNEEMQLEINRSKGCKVNDGVVLPLANSLDQEVPHVGKQQCVCPSPKASQQLSAHLDPIREQSMQCELQSQPQEGILDHQALQELYELACSEGSENAAAATRRISAPSGSDAGTSALWGKVFVKVDRLQAEYEAMEASWARMLHPKK